jgi:transposase
MMDKIKSFTGQKSPEVNRRLTMKVQQRRKTGHWSPNLRRDEISRYEAAEEYGISSQTARDYMRMYRDAKQLPPKQNPQGSIRTPSSNTTPAGLEEFKTMTKEELIQELVKARITEAR